MRCQNCSHTDSFVLLIDFAVRVTTDGPPGPEWSVAVQCPACDSTDVVGNPTYDSTIRS